MSLIDTFGFLLEADPDKAVAGIEEVGNAFDDLKKSGQEDANDVAKSFERAGDKIKSVSDAIDRDIADIEGVSKLGAEADRATIEFVEMANQATNASQSVSASFAKAMMEVVRDSGRARDSLDDLGNSTSIKNLISKLKEAGVNTEALEAKLKKSGKPLDELPPKVNSLAQLIREKLGGAADSVDFGGMAKGFVAAAAAGFTLNAVMDRTANLMGRIRDAETVGVDVSQYDALLRTFSALGVDADAFRDSMIDLNEAMGEAAADAESGKAKAFGALGVKLKDTTGRIKSTDEALLELADSMSKMTKQQATFQIKQLGITDNKVIAAMLSGRKELERLLKVQKQYGTLTQDDAQQIRRFSLAVSDLQTMSSHFADKLMVLLAPALAATAEGIANLSQWFSELINYLSDHMGLVVGALLPVAYVALPALATAFWAAATAAWAMIAPLLPFIALIVAAGLVVDDLWNYFNGGESVIGDLAKKFDWLNTFLQTTKELFLELIQLIKEFADNPMKVMQGWGDSLKSGWEDAKSWFSGDDGQGPLGVAQSAVAANNAIVGASNAPQIPSNIVSNTSGGNTIQQTNDVKVTVGSGDPDAVARGVSQGLGQNLQQTAAALDDGRSH